MIPLFNNKKFILYRKLLLPKLIIGLLLPLGSFTNNVLTTNCDQKFTFFFKMQYDDTFWIGEDLYGECGQSNLIQIFLSGEKVQAKKMELAQFEKWDWIEQAKKVMRIESPFTFIPNSSQTIENDNIGIKLRKPKYNPDLLNKFSDEFVGSCAKQWNQKMGIKGIDLPQSWSWDLDLVYYHPDGLYFNYQIDKVYVFPESNFLLVMTKYDKRCAGGDTMNGFMLLKFKEI
ncbi:MAG: hypothetical protein MUE81_18890 [Thermoflexibacter sp.]|nr:hypothetical protein [Thermoflexibacter sp.]